jgi:hypothetical protein
MKQTAERLICVGTVYRGGKYIVAGYLSSEACLSVNWRGQTDWCQPWQFMSERQLTAAVRLRLSMAALAMNAISIGTGEYAPITCIVSRLREGKHVRARAINAMRQRWADEARAGSVDGAPPAGAREAHARALPHPEALTKY